MGNAAPASNPVTSVTPQRAANHTNSNVQSPRRRGGNNFMEVQVGNSSNHSRTDYRTDAQRREAETRHKAVLEHQRQVAAAHSQREQQEAGRHSHNSDSAMQGTSRHNHSQPEGRKGVRHQAPMPANISEYQPDQVVFETYVSKEGKEFICAYRNGKRFYLDSWHSQEWLPFPERWYNEGTLNCLDENELQETYAQRSSNQQHEHRQERARQRDDREGFLKHPKRGRVDTYLLEERRYIHFFFDKFSGNWMRLPVGWEIHHPLIESMIRRVQEAVPTWKDPADILSALRVCNYNIDETIGTYLHLDGDEWLVAPRSTKEVKEMSDSETLLETLKEKVKSLELELKNEQKMRHAAETQLDELQDKYSNLVAEAGIAKSQIEAMQTSRPKTARPKTPQVKKKASVADGLDLQQLEGLTVSVRELHKTHSHLRMTVTSQVEILRELLVDTSKAVKDIRSCESGSQQELEEVRALYQKEALQRRLLYNQLQELRGNIRVFCRPRRDDRCSNCLKFPSEQDVMVINRDGTKKIFNYDKVYTTESTQEEVFKDTQPIITSCVDGYNVCLMAYGQTGSGKTFTMMGPESNPGINIRAITELLKVCKERTETKTYTMMVSMVEIYNETIQDLLTEGAVKTLELHAVGNMIRIPNITEIQVNSVNDVKDVMALGELNRSVAETKMNSESSRSHLLLRITVSGTDKVSGAISNGVLTLCDLAGSERISKTEASGQRLVEAAAINKSLSALGQVFTAMRSSQLHVPYRNSKLTQILRPCLGGDAKACLFVNISPDVKNFNETCNTLEFGSNARQVALGQAKQNIRKGPDPPP